MSNMQKVITGFHSIEEILRSRNKEELECAFILFSSCGPRAKKVIEIAKSRGVPIHQVEKKEIEKKVAHLPDFLQDHKGIILVVKENLIDGKGCGILKKHDLDEFIKNTKNSKNSASKKFIIGPAKRIKKRSSLGFASKDLDLGAIC